MGTSFPSLLPTAGLGSTGEAFWAGGRPTGGANNAPCTHAGASAAYATISTDPAMPTPPNEQNKPAGQLRAFIEQMKREAGGDSEIVKQCVADLNAQQRQDARNFFE